ncbi:hypothetical protein FDF74_11665 [Clostridium niameyense]|uniref:Uncharacterized protein n=1 Tax=Clostridium niameyense TaxID=1622073 RepID=A0A6M0REG4_9CLOT|nr:DUF5406 family protein [Clostridium niameyense]NEZ47838.1 hypothetical protein [Clostridium niameyense]
MKKYDISDNFRERIHTIRVTFQYQEYKGHIAYEIGGNCRGLNVMDVDFDCIDEDDINNLKENDCNFKFNYEYEVYGLSLKDEEGNICEMNDIEEDEINDYVVAIEIIDCRIDED